MYKKNIMCEIEHVGALLRYALHLRPAVGLFFAGRQLGRLSPQMDRWLHTGRMSLAGAMCKNNTWNRPRCAEICLVALLFVPLFTLPPR